VAGWIALPLQGNQINGFLLTGSRQTQSRNCHGFGKLSQYELKVQRLPCTEPGKTHSLRESRIRRVSESHLFDDILVELSHIEVYLGCKSSAEEST